MPGVTLVDGVPAAAVPIDDRGFHYGDGLFETIALCDGHPQHWERHLARLARGAERLSLAGPSADDWQDDLERACAAAPPPRRAVVKLILTRGSGGRGYAPPPRAHVRRVLQLLAWPPRLPEHASGGIRIMPCSTPLGRNRLLAGLKHLNRLEQVLGAAEVAAAGADEGLMFTDRDELIEGTRSNVFLARGGEWLTPQLDEAGVAGIVRELVLEIAPRVGIAVHETRIARGLLARAEEIFVCNSLVGICPVRELFGSTARRFEAWPLTVRTLEALRAEGALA